MKLNSTISNPQDHSYRYLGTILTVASSKMSLSDKRQVKFPTGLSMWNRRTLYICLSAPRSSALPCPPHYEWSLIVANSYRTGNQMTHHSLVPQYYDSQVTNSPRPSSERFYQELPLDNSSSRYYQIVALINMKKAYKIDDEEGFASIIQDVDNPPLTANADTWVRNCVWHLARTGKISQVEEKDWGDDIWVEMERRCLGFMDAVARDNRPEFGSSERARRGRLVGPRIIPALVFRGERMPPLPPEQQSQNKAVANAYGPSSGRSPQREYRH